ncbi:MAG: hypothetical protein ACD_3C00115G0001 [uncultured bacterium (gcode 4)]|uniref:Prepilin-type N-terminal cleavage/methylation domain-containing protein n=1 Tax=uncultured bacterium (gcode 4) TaxID=1234023 RepID=K2FA10_9BACT|nr:MAG: hypothetical protein ACD_3C00115G0001 [uncultured bacterium (gcode 4)]
MNTQKTNNNNAFTLVELIVVIVILAILATIAFLSFSNQSGSARDSVRLSDTTNIRKWLELRQAIGWSIPLPANPKSYSWWATATWVSGVMITEWTVNNSILSTLSAGIKDPSWSEYRYSTISQWWQPLYYQLALELENPTSMREDVINPFIAFNEDIASADTASSKIVQLKWNYMFNPSLPSLFILSGSTSSASGWIYNPDICFVLDWSATNSFSSKDCIAKKDMRLKDYDDSLVWYWDMETNFNSWGITYLKDLSWNSNDGAASWSIIIWWSWGLIWKSTFFDWINDYFQIKNNPTLNFESTFTFEAIYTYSKSYTWAWWNPILDKPYTSHTPPYYQYHFWVTSPNYSSAPWKCWFQNFFAVSYKFDCSWFDNQIYHVVTKYDWTTASMWINWKKIAETKINKTFTDYGLDLFIWVYGGLLNSSIYYLAWNIDELKIYNRALSDTEIIQQAKSAWF